MDTPALQATLWCHPDAARARPVTVSFRFDGIELRFADGARLVPYGGDLRLALGGLDGDRVILESGEGESLLHLQADPGHIALLLPRIPDPALRAKLIALLPAAADRRARAANLGWRVAGYLLGFLVALWLAWGPLVSFSVGRIPASWERSLGSGAARQLIAGRVEITSGTAHRNLNELFRRLVAATDAPHCEFRLHLVRDDAVNAFALPGGVVVVHTALLEKAKSAEEVAGVLAHEIEHAVRRHGMRRVMNGLGLGAVATVLFGDAGTLLAVAQQAALELGLKSYDRDQEREADDGAVDRLVRARIDPAPFAAFFDRLREEGGDLPGGLGWLSTHPASSERAERIRARAREALAGESFRPLELPFDLADAK